jgi:hypothetical protein
MGLKKNSRTILKKMDEIKRKKLRDLLRSNKLQLKQVETWIERQKIINQGIEEILYGATKSEKEN